MPIGRSQMKKAPSRWAFLLAGVTVLALFCLASGTLLMKQDALPGHVDGAVVLQGLPGENVRVRGGIELLQRGQVSGVILSLPAELYWGESIEPVVRRYLERKYGNDLASHIVFCETEREVNSTRQEAEALSGCIQKQHWHDLVVVTSYYHSRRAGMIWTEVMSTQDGGTKVFTYGVSDPEFQRFWWRSRLSAKIWFMEFTKLVWAETLGRLEG